MEPFGLICYRLGNAVPLAPARRERDIFDANRHAYRCLPLTIANTCGWELSCPTGVTITWDGGSDLHNLTVEFDDPDVFPFAKSQFATGIVTFELGWLFRTPPGHHLWVMGPTNDPKDGIAPLSGIMETDWLPYTFTMNWKMTRPGTVRFEKGEPFCLITPGSIGAVADCQPVERQIADDAELAAALHTWTQDRVALMDRMAAGDPETMKHPWGRLYFRGEDAPDRHFQKLRAKPLEGRPAVLSEDGRLTRGSRTRLVQCAADAAGQDFLVVDELVSADVCDELAAVYARGSDHYEQPKEAFWQDRILAYRDVCDLDAPAGLAMRKAMIRAIGKVRGFYRIATPIYPDTLHLVGWAADRFMPPHADNAYASGEPHALAHRAYSGLLYLTDDYEGGELYLPRQDIAIRPRKGMFVSLPAGLDHEHAVVRVERGERVTMPFFLTFERDRAVESLL